MNDRIPAWPLIANDPYFSVWCAADRLTDTDTTHWTGAPHPLRGTISVDGRAMRWLGHSQTPAMTTKTMDLTATATTALFEDGGISLKVIFRTAALPEDLDLLSTPITSVSFEVSSADGAPHSCEINFSVSDMLTWCGTFKPEILRENYVSDGLRYAYCGQLSQRPLSHTGDHVTMDWGYLYLVGESGVSAENGGLAFKRDFPVDAEHVWKSHVLIAYDDIASILYFGVPCKPWYARSGKTLPQAISDYEKDFDAIMKRCDQLDVALSEEAEALGGEDYRLITNAGWRHCFAAHKLISAPDGKPALISKENDSNGCAATVDVSYPTTPIFLRFCPELVAALCKPILEFASKPVWEYDFAPHDAGRYPILFGQLYASRITEAEYRDGSVPRPFYLLPPGTDAYRFRNQMPVEECGNMLIMLALHAKRTGDVSLARAYYPLLEKWVRYLYTYGENPGEQLCTDDFAGHLNANVNLSAKAIVGIACFGLLEKAISGKENTCLEDARKMAGSWLRRCAGEHGTALTFTDGGWSMKYNLIWDKLLHLELFPQSFYESEVESYLPKINAFGLPLDCRAQYTKADWLVWSACLTDDKAKFKTMIHPLAEFLRRTPSRVPFSDWYDTVNGAYCHFIARPVIGGCYMPFLKADMAE